MLPYADFTNSRRVIRMKDAMPTDPKAPDPSVNALYTAITTGYFDALGVKLLRGRDFTQAECETKRCAARRHHRRRDGEETFSERRRNRSAHSLHPTRQRTARLTTWKLSASSANICMPSKATPSSRGSSCRWRRVITVKLICTCASIPKIDAPLSR